MPLLGLLKEAVVELLFPWQEVVGALSYVVVGEEEEGDHPETVEVVEELKSKQANTQ